MFAIAGLNCENPTTVLGPEGYKTNCYPTLYNVEVFLFNVSYYICFVLNFTPILKVKRTLLKHLRK